MSHKKDKENCYIDGVIREEGFERFLGYPMMYKRELFALINCSKNDLVKLARERHAPAMATKNVLIEKLFIHYVMIINGIDMLPSRDLTPLDENDIDENDFLSESTEEPSEEDIISSHTAEELEIQLNQAIENEDYELASKIRDEIQRRQA